MVEREREREEVGYGGLIGPTSAEDPTLLTPAFLHLLLAPPVVAVFVLVSIIVLVIVVAVIVIVAVVVRAARKFPFSLFSERRPRRRVARLKNPRS